VEVVNRKSKRYEEKGNTWTTKKRGQGNKRPKKKKKP
jgi:hypothetical protein